MTHPAEVVEQASKTDDNETVFRPVCPCGWKGWVSRDRVVARDDAKNHRLGG